MSMMQRAQKGTAFWVDNGGFKIIGVMTDTVEAGFVYLQCCHANHNSDKPASRRLATRYTVPLLFLVRVSALWPKVAYERSHPCDGNSALNKVEAAHNQGARKLRGVHPHFNLPSISGQQRHEVGTASREVDDQGRPRPES